MVNFGAVLRRILLCVAMAGSLFANIIPFRGPAYDLLYLAAGCSIFLYLIIGVLSILIRIVRTIRMDEFEKMKDTLLITVITDPNSDVINFFRRLSFWGAISLFAAEAFGVNVQGLSQNGNMFFQSYSGFFTWTIFAFFCSFLISVIYWIFYIPHGGEGSYTIFQYIWKLLVADILTPFRTIKNLFSRDMPRGRSLFYFIVMIVFILYHVICIRMCRI